MSNNLSLIFARSQNNIIGKDNDLPWSLPNDFAWFKKKTSGHTIIMGRKTFESLKGPLPNRKNIVLSSNPNLNYEGVTQLTSLQDALLEAKHSNDTEPFVIGGTQVFQSALPLANRIYLTEVLAEYEGDTSGPIIDLSEWKQVFEERHPADERHSDNYQFKIFERI